MSARHRCRLPTRKKFDFCFVHFFAHTRARKRTTNSNHNNNISCDGRRRHCKKVNAKEKEIVTTLVCVVEEPRRKKLCAKCWPNGQDQMAPLSLSLIAAASKRKEEEKTQIKREQFVLSAVARAWNFIYRFHFEVIASLVRSLHSFSFIFFVFRSRAQFNLCIYKTVQVQVQINGWCGRVDGCPSTQRTVARRSPVFHIFFLCFVFACSGLICIRFCK